MAITDPGKLYDTTYDRREYFAEAASSLGRFLQIVEEAKFTELDVDEIKRIKRECENEVAQCNAVMGECMRLEDRANGRR
jgi:hypothetical protein